MKPSSKLYSINEGYAASWTPELKGYIDSLKVPGAGWKQRYIGSLVADFHRNLIKGGLFVYPATSSAPEGKLRMLYEAFPLAFVCETAGGSATDGKTRILDLCPSEFHARTPLFIGNREDVAQVTEVLSQEK